MNRASRFVAVFTMAVFLLTGAAVLLAQAQAKDSEADLYTAWYNEKDAGKKADIAKKYMEKYPKGQYAAYMQQTVVQYKFQQFGAAWQSHNTADLFKIANEFLADPPQGVDTVTFLYWPALESHRLTMARNYSFEKEGRDFTQKAVTEIEGGKIPAMFQDRAKFESTDKNKVLALLYQNLGLIDAHNKLSEQAVGELQKALTLDSTQPYTVFQLGVLFQGKYDADLQKYNAIADKNSPEAKAQLDVLHKDEDDAIDAMGRFIALTAGKSEWANQRNSVDSALKAFWKERHPEDPDGSQKAVDKFKTSTANSPAPGN